MRPIRPRFLGAVLFSALFTLLLLEAVVRGYFATQVGPRLWLYGTRWKVVAADLSKDRSVSTHLRTVGGYREYDPTLHGSYAKYFPNEVRFTPSPDRREYYEARINNQGFRGADFTTEKPPDTFRILTMGASSTFGYHDRDDETYPYYLGQILNQRAAGSKHFEVINFAVPHAASNNILAMFLAEGVQLAPDLVTFYEGANDAVIVERAEPGLVGRGWEALRQWSLAAEFINYSLRLGVVNEHYTWSDELAERRTKAFLANLESLRQECRQRGIRLVVATQQMKSELVKPEDMKGLTYDDEVRMVRERVARGEIGPSRPAPWVVVQPIGALLAVFYSPRVMLIHSRLMNEERAWAAAHPDVGFVDVVKALDQDRDLLANWVHLRAEANRKIAEALAPEILRQQSGSVVTLPTAHGG